MTSFIGRATSTTTRSTSGSSPTSRRSAAMRTSASCRRPSTPTTTEAARSGLHAQGVKVEIALDPAEDLVADGPGVAEHGQGVPFGLEDGRPDLAVLEDFAFRFVEGQLPGGVELHVPRPVAVRDPECLDQLEVTGPLPFELVDARHGSLRGGRPGVRLLALVAAVRGDAETAD